MSNTVIFESAWSTWISNLHVCKSDKSQFQCKCWWIDKMESPQAHPLSRLCMCVSVCVFVLGLLVQLEHFSASHPLCSRRPGLCVRTGQVLIGLEACEWSCFLWMGMNSESKGPPCDVNSCVFDQRVYGKSASAMPQIGINTPPLCVLVSVC